MKHEQPHEHDAPVERVFRKKSAAAETVDLYRYKMLQTLSDDMNEKIRDVAAHFVAGIEDAEPVRMNLTKNTRLSIHQQDGKTAIFTVFALNKKQQPVDSIGEFRLQKVGGRFILYDRMVSNTANRQKGTGSLLLGAAERFIAEVTEEGKEGILSVDIGQGYLIDWFENRGYQPTDPAALQSLRAELQAGALIQDHLGYLYQKDTPVSRQMGVYTIPEYHRRIMMEKKIKSAAKAV